MAYREEGMPAVGGSDNGQEIYTVEDLEWVNNGCLSARFTLTILSSGLRIFNCVLFTKGCSRWVGLPSERFRGEDGRPAFKPLIGFRSKADKASFLHGALEEVDRYLSRHCSSEPQDGRSAIALFDDDDDSAEGSEVNHV